MSTLWPGPVITVIPAPPRTVQVGYQLDCSATKYLGWASAISAELIEFSVKYMLAAILLILLSSV